MFLAVQKKTSLLQDTDRAILSRISLGFSTFVFLGVRFLGCFFFKHHDIYFVLFSIHAQASCGIFLRLNVVIIREVRMICFHTCCTATLLRICVGWCMTVISRTKTFMVEFMLKEQLEFELS